MDKETITYIIGLKEGTKKKYTNTIIDSIEPIRVNFTNEVNGTIIMTLADKKDQVLLLPFTDIAFMIPEKTTDK